MPRRRRRFESLKTRARALKCFVVACALIIARERERTLTSSHLATPLKSTIVSLTVARSLARVCARCRASLFTDDFVLAGDDTRRPPPNSFDSRATAAGAHKRAPAIEGAERWRKKTGRWRRRRRLQATVRPAADRELARAHFFRLGHWLSARTRDLTRVSFDRRRRRWAVDFTRRSRICRLSPARARARARSHHTSALATHAREQKRHPLRKGERAARPRAV